MCVYLGRGLLLDSAFSFASSPFGFGRRSDYIGEEKGILWGKVPCSRLALQTALRRKRESSSLQKVVKLASVTSPLPRFFCEPMRQVRGAASFRMRAFLLFFRSCGLLRVAVAGRSDVLVVPAVISSYLETNKRRFEMVAERGRNTD